MRGRKRRRSPGVRQAAGALVAFAVVCGSCRGGRETADARESAVEDQSDPPAADAEPDIERVRIARAALAHARIPLYPGARGLDATEFEANTAPFVAVDFFTTDPPEKVAAFYDRALKRLTARRTTSAQAGAVRYEFDRAYSGVEVKPWQPQAADSTGMLARFDRRDAQGVTSAQLDSYGKFLAKARSHVVVNIPRPDAE